MRTIRVADFDNLQLDQVTEETFFVVHGRKSAQTLFSMDILGMMENVFDPNAQIIPPSAEKLSVHRKEWEFLLDNDWKFLIYQPIANRVIRLDEGWG